MKKRKKHYTFTDDEELNPLSSVSNLSDVMLILTVGIMMALIVHWNVNLGSSDSTSAAGSEQSAQEDVISFSEGDLENTQELPSDMEPAGEVYYDAANDRYYIVKSGE